MAKKTLKENIRVEVTPSYIKSEEDQISVCNDIVKQIERHIDDLGNVYTTWDVLEICEFCGYDWEVNEDPNDPDYKIGEPICCTAAQEEFAIP